MYCIDFIATVSFYSSEDDQEFNIAKSKVQSKFAGNWQVLL